MKPKVAIFDFASCEGCELQVVNLEEEVVDLVNMVDVVSFREAMKEHSNEYDVAIVEGGIERPMDEKRIKDIRSKAKILIALGDCACTGGVNKLRNDMPSKEVKKEVYGSAKIDDNPLFDVFPKAKALDEVVPVDFYIRGCPVRKEQVLYYIKRFYTMPPHKNLDLRFEITSRNAKLDERAVIQYDPNKCILCRRCDAVCNEALDVHAIGISSKGSNTIISTPFDVGLDTNKCILCGQCLVNCSVGAFTEESHVNRALELLSDDSNFVVFVIDPIAVTSSIEKMPTDEKDLGIFIRKLISALKDMNVKEVVDFTQFMYLSIAAQGEFIQKNREVCFTSWCPSTHIYIEKFYPQYKKYIHDETSPERQLFSVLRNRYKGKNLKIILVTPCIVHKGNKEFDAVLTSRELPRLLRNKDVDLGFYPHIGVTFDCDLGMIPKFVSGGFSDFAYSLNILQLAYFDAFKNLDAALTMSSIEDYVHEIVFDSDLGMFNALVIENLNMARKYLKEDITKYNVIEMYPCFRGCFTGGGQCLTVSEDVIKDRREMLRNYKGEVGSPYEFISQIISVYRKIKGASDDG